MAEIAIQSFLTVEKSLVFAILNPWLEEVGRPLAQRVNFHVARGEFGQAREAVRALTLDTAGENLGRVDVLGLSALLVGESFFAGSKALGAVGSGKKAAPFEVEAATQALANNLRFEGARQVQQIITDQISLEEKAVLQLAELSLVDRINRSVLGGGGRVIEAGANLTTSRLVTFGALSEAAELGAGTYQISEILDDVICPVCLRMHGKIFRVGPALDQLTQQLNVPDPAALKGAFPFPKQTRAGVDDLTSMSIRELEDKGWNRPPFHPGCRGVPVPVGTVQVDEMVPFVPLVQSVPVERQTRTAAAAAAAASQDD